MQRSRARPARARSHSFLLYLSFFSVLQVSQVSGIKVTRTVVAEDLAATSVSVLGVGPDGLTTFRAFEPEELGGANTNTLTQIFLANSVILIQSDFVDGVTEVDSCDLTSTLAGLVQCVVVSPDSSGHLETETVAAGVNTLSYVIDVADGNGTGLASSSSSPSGATSSPSPSPSLTGLPHSSSSSPFITTTSSSLSTTPSGSNPTSRNKSNVGTIVGAILSSIAFLLVLLLTLYLLRKKRLNRSHQDGTTSVAAPFAEISVRRHPTLTPFALAGTADGRGDHSLGPGAGFMKTTPGSSSISALTTGISETSPDNSSHGALVNTHQPPIASSTTATTTVPVNAVPNPSPRPGNSGNNVLIEAMYHLQERLAKLENQMPAAQDPSAVPRMSHADGFGDGMMGRDRRDYLHERQGEDPPTYVA